MSRGLVCGSDSFMLDETKEIFGAWSANYIMTIGINAAFIGIGAVLGDAVYTNRRLNREG